MLWGIPAEVNRFFRPVVRDVSKPIRKALAPMVLAWYEIRWQIELFFRELRSRMRMRCYVFKKFEAVERYLDLLLMGFLLLEKRRSDDLISTSKWPTRGDAMVHWRTTDRLRNLESWIQRFNLDYISKRLESKRGRAELLRKLAETPCQVA